MNSPLPPVIRRWREEAITWPYFLSKAGKGSWHAPALVHSAEWYLLSLVNQEPRSVVNQAPSEQEWNTIMSQDAAEFLVPTCPWAHRDNYLHDLATVAGLPKLVTPDSMAFHPEEYYSSLWEKQLQVSEAEMIFDSWPVIQRNWSPDEYDQLEIDLNALHALAAMVHLCVSIRDLEARAAGR